MEDTEAKCTRIVGEPTDDPTLFTSTAYLDLWRSTLRKWNWIRIWDDDLKGFCGYRIESIRPHPQHPNSHVLISFPYAGTSLVTGEHPVRLSLIFPAD
jgi:hypothetical protein